MVIVNKILNLDLFLIIFLIVITTLFFLIQKLNNFILISVFFFQTLLVITMFLYYLGFNFTASLYLIIYGGGIMVIYFIVMQFNSEINYSKINIKFINYLNSLNWIFLGFMCYFNTIQYENYKIKPIILIFNRIEGSYLNSLIFSISVTNSLLFLLMIITLVLTLYFSLKLLKVPNKL